jgi:hypothetical protein
MIFAAKCLCVSFSSGIPKLNGKTQIFEANEYQPAMVETVIYRFMAVLPKPINIKTTRITHTALKKKHLAFTKVYPLAN